MNRREKLQALADLHRRTSVAYALTSPAGDGEKDHSVWNAEFHGNPAMDREYFSAAQRILGHRPVTASGVSLAADGDPEVTAMAFHKESDNPDCPGEVAVVNDDSGQVEGCYASEEDANAALERLNGGASAGGAEAAAAQELVDQLAVAGEFDFQGPLVVEGIMSGDGRRISEGALTWRDLPLPLMLQTTNPEKGGHAGAVVCGSIHDIQRRGDEVWGFGFFDSGADGQEAKRLIGEGTMRGVSVDLDMTEIEFQTPEGEPAPMDEIDILFGPDENVVLGVTAGRIMGATLTPFPAFQEAYLELLNPTDVLVASGTVERPAHPARWHQPFQREAIDALVASAAAVASPQYPTAPPIEWFEKPSASQIYPVTIEADGRIHGYVAEWGDCHIGFANTCVKVPRCQAGLRKFNNKGTLTEEGRIVLTGPLYIDYGHAPLHLNGDQAEDYMANVMHAIGDVVAYEDELGLCVAGGVRPTATAEQVRVARGSDISPDWRPSSDKFGHEMRGLHCVSVSGFAVPAPLVASGRLNLETGEFGALVGVGMVRKDERGQVIADLQHRLKVVENFVLQQRHERALARFSTTQLVEGTIEHTDCACEDPAACSCEV